jgi:hypothetical protein
MRNLIHDRIVIEDVSDRLQVALWGLASGIMVSASVFGLIVEGMAEADGRFDYLLLVVGLLAGVVLVVVAGRILSEHHFDPRHYEEADFGKLVLILGILTVHSFPEGVAEKEHTFKRRQGTCGHYGEEIEGQEEAAREKGQTERTHSLVGHAQDRPRGDAQSEAPQLA